MRTTMWWRRAMTCFNRGRLDDELRAEIAVAALAAALPAWRALTIDPHECLKAQ